MVYLLILKYFLVSTTTGINRNSSIEDPLEVPGEATVHPLLSLVIITRAIAFTRPPN